MNSDKIAELRALLEEATPGEWEPLVGADHAIAISRTPVSGSSRVATLIGCADIEDDDPIVLISEEDRAFICAMKAHAPALLTAAEDAARLQREVEALRATEGYRLQQYGDLLVASKDALKVMQFRTQSSQEFGDAKNRLFSAIDRLGRDGKVYGALTPPASSEEDAS